MRASKSSAVVAAPIVGADRARLAFGDDQRELDCLYVHVDISRRRDVADFLAEWQRCCDTVAVDWRSVRRPQSALVGLELRRCCGDEPATPALRLVFDIRRDRAALEALIETESLVVGSRPFGRFANSMVAYGVTGKLVRQAIRAAERGLETSDAVVS